MINDRLVDEWIGSMYTENGVYNSDSDGDRFHGFAIIEATFQSVLELT